MSHDLVTVSVTSAPRLHVLKGKIERIFSCRNGIALEHLGTEIEFVRGPISWGNTSLEINDRALLFVRSRAYIFHEYPWRGHMVLEDIDGELCAILNFPQLWLREDLPIAVRTRCHQHPSKKNQSFVPFHIIEGYLTDLIADTHRHEL